MTTGWNESSVAVMVGSEVKVAAEVHGMAPSAHTRARRQRQARTTAVRRMLAVAAVSSVSPVAEGWTMNWSSGTSQRTQQWWKAAWTPPQIRWWPQTAAESPASPTQLAAVLVAEDETATVETSSSSSTTHVSPEDLSNGPAEWTPQPPSSMPPPFLMSTDAASQEDSSLYVPRPVDLEGVMLATFSASLTAAHMPWPVALVAAWTTTAVVATTPPLPVTPALGRGGRLFVVLLEAVGLAVPQLGRKRDDDNDEEEEEALLWPALRFLLETQRQTARLWQEYSADPVWKEIAMLEDMEQLLEEEIEMTNDDDDDNSDDDVPPPTAVKSPPSPTSTTTPPPPFYLVAPWQSSPQQHQQQPVAVGKKPSSVKQPTPWLVSLWMSRRRTTKASTTNKSNRVVDKLITSDPGAAEFVDTLPFFLGASQDNNNHKEQSVAKGTTVVASTAAAAVVEEEEAVVVVATETTTTSAAPSVATTSTEAGHRARLAYRLDLEQQQRQREQQEKEQRHEANQRALLAYRLDLEREQKQKQAQVVKTEAPKEVQAVVALSSSSQSIVAPQEELQEAATVVAGIAPETTPVPLAPAPAQQPVTTTMTNRAKPRAITVPLSTRWSRWKQWLLRKSKSAAAVPALATTAEYHMRAEQHQRHRLLRFLFQRRVRRAAITVIFLCALTVVQQNPHVILRLLQQGATTGAIPARAVANATTGVAAAAASLTLV